MCSFTWSNDQELVRAQLVGKQTEILLFFYIAIRRNSNYQDDNEIKENIVMFTNAFHVILYTKCPILAIQRPKRQYNLKHYTLSLLHCDMCVHITFSSVSVAEWPPFGKWMAIFCLCTLTICNIYYFPF